MEFTLHGSDFTLTPRSEELEEHELKFVKIQAGLQKRIFFQKIVIYNIIKIEQREGTAMRSVCELDRLIDEENFDVEAAKR